VLDDVLVRHNTAYEQYIVRDNTALGVARVNVPQLNLNALKTDGFDIEVDYAVPIGALKLPGQLNLRALGTYIDDSRTITATTDIDAAGTSAAPTWSWNFQARYSTGPFAASLMARYTAPIKFSATLIGPDDPNYNIALSNSINRNRWPAALYFNTYTQYTFNTSVLHPVQAYFNIDNILDKKPPVVAISINGSAYDLVGRAFKLGFRVIY
jgi:outer membrane receptor protein involved in Fe transport